MAEHPIEGLMGVTMQKIKEMVDVNTIIGEPVITPDGTTIIPVSKVSFGFASGGSDLPTSQPKQTFGGGGGAGKVVNSVPDIIDKISDAIVKAKDQKSGAAKPEKAE